MGPAFWASASGPLKGGFASPALPPHCSVCGSLWLPPGNSLSPWQKVPPLSWFHLATVRPNKWIASLLLADTRKQPAWQLPRRDRSEDVWFWNELEGCCGMLTPTCHCSGSGLMVRPRCLTHWSACCCQDGSVQAGLCAVSYAFSPGEASLLISNAPLSPFPRLLDKYPLIIELSLDPFMPGHSLPLWS